MSEFDGEDISSTDNRKLKETLKHMAKPSKPSTALAKRGRQAVAPVRRAGLSGSVEAGGDEESRELQRGGSGPGGDLAGQRQYSDKPNFDADDIKMPRLKIAQGLSAEVTEGDAQIGQILLLGNDPADRVILVPMVFGKGRELREDAGQGPIMCQSGDAKVGVGDPGGSCTRCEYAQWADGKKGERVPPECVFYYSYGFWSETHQSMVLMDFKKTAIPAAQTLNSLVQQNGGFGGFAVELSTSSQKGKKGTFAVPVIKVAKVKPDVLQAAQEHFTFGRTPAYDDTGAE